MSPLEGDIGGGELKYKSYDLSYSVSDMIEEDGLKSILTVLTNFNFFVSSYLRTWQPPPAPLLEGIKDCENMSPFRGE